MTDDILSHAIALAEKGFYVFPLRPNSKLPAAPNWQEHATRDIDQLKIWWSRNPKFNIGIFTGKFNGEGEALIGVDVDVKEGKKGDETLKALEAEGFKFPKTFTQITPTKGRHFIYKTKKPMTGGTDVLGSGLDIRSNGQYLVGQGSIIDSIKYTFVDHDIIDSPDELVSRLNTPKKKETASVKIDVNQERAYERAKYYLENEAPIAVEGEGGDQTTFTVAATLKDFGLEQEQAFNALMEFWNEKCSPPWSIEALRAKVSNAYRYGVEFQGSKNPEILFKDPIETKPEGTDLSPIEELNKEYAFIVIQGKAFVLREYKDENGLKSVEYLGLHTFHEKLKSETIFFSDKKHQLSQIWMASPKRRSFDGICFLPEKTPRNNSYNLWTGFSVKPSDQVSELAKESVNMFLKHTLENICRNDENVFKWLISYFAHLIQKPYEKPLVACVFKGKKGVGKNAFIERIGYLLKNHFSLTSDSRYLFGNFNSHLEKCLLIVLDEAFWSGDKKAEGALKNLITGTNHFIERKGHEAYMSKNLTRVVVIGNEDWLVPASHDERRFAVFDVAAGNKNDYAFFEKMRTGMESGGYSYLLKYLKEYDISKVNINKAPATDALAEQKISSLGHFHEYWFDCLKNGRLLHTDFDKPWADDWVEIEKTKLRDAYRRSIREKNSSSWVESDAAIGKLMKVCCPHFKEGRKQNDGTRVYTYKIPPLKQCRKEWEEFMDHVFRWDFDSDQDTLTDLLT